MSEDKKGRVVRDYLNDILENIKEDLLPLKKAVEYAEGTANTRFYSTSVIDSLLKPFLDASTSYFSSKRVL